MSGTAAQEERAKWRANERADRAEAYLAAVIAAAERLLRFCPAGGSSGATHGPFVDAADNLRSVIAHTDPERETTGDD